MTQVQNNRCRFCARSRAVVSENGLKYNCTLSQRKAVACVLGLENHCVVSPLVKREVLNVRMSQEEKSNGR